MEVEFSKQDQTFIVEGSDMLVAALNEYYLDYTTRNPDFKIMGSFALNIIAIFAAECTLQTLVNAGVKLSHSELIASINDFSQHYREMVLSHAQEAGVIKNND